MDIHNFILIVHTSYCMTTYTGIWYACGLLERTPKFGYPASCASCALMTDNSWFFVRKSHTAG